MHYFQLLDSKTSSSLSDSEIHASFLGSLHRLGLNVNWENLCCLLFLIVVHTRFQIPAIVKRDQACREQGSRHLCGLHLHLLSTIPAAACLEYPNAQTVDKCLSVGTNTLCWRPRHLLSSRPAPAPPFHSRILSAFFCFLDFCFCTLLPCLRLLLPRDSGLATPANIDAAYL
jgi:hypothetical protein